MQFDLRLGWNSIDTANFGVLVWFGLLNGRFEMSTNYVIRYCILMVQLLSLYITYYIL